MKMTQIIGTAVLGVLLTCGSPALGASFAGKVQSILFYEQGDLVYIYVTGGTQGRPAWSGSNGDDLSFSVKRLLAKEYNSGRMFAFAAEKSVTTQTEGPCLDQPESNTLRWY